jgi:hypothetical protein
LLRCIFALLGKGRSSLESGHLVKTYFDSFSGLFFARPVVPRSPATLALLWLVALGLQYGQGGDITTRTFIVNPLVAFFYILFFWSAVWLHEYG